jgi:hypothetical protein
MLKKISRSDIPLEYMPVIRSNIRKCKVCRKNIRMADKFIVFNEFFVPFGYSCKYCHSVYLENDILIMLGNSDKVDIYGEA